jgi:hypothetical protein
MDPNSLNLPLKFFWIHPPALKVTLKPTNLLQNVDVGEKLKIQFGITIQRRKIRPFDPKNFRLPSSKFQWSKI